MQVTSSNVHTVLKLQIVFQSINQSINQFILPTVQQHKNEH